MVNSRMLSFLIHFITFSLLFSDAHDIAGDLVAVLEEPIVSELVQPINDLYQSNKILNKLIISCVIYHTYIILLLFGLTQPSSKPI